ncbi:hypothetical protein ACH5RR_041061 [Cinchona calisaya]|uniref:Protein TIC 20 n=1 Tax=Cinchona calisaya TaxID=153742 RepID=A0ABD2XSW7_9GENT
MILHGWTLKSGAVSVSYKACNPKSNRLASSGIPHLPAKAVVSCAGSSWSPHPRLISCSKGPIGRLPSWFLMAYFFVAYLGVGVAIAYVFTVLESMRCALTGMYADIPFVCDAACIQIPDD